MKKGIILIVLFCIAANVFGQQSDSVFTFIKNKPILTFTKPEMLDDKGNFNFDDVDKLPWRFESIAEFIKPYKQIEYNVLKFSNKDDAKNYFFMTYNIDYDREKNTIAISQEADADETYSISADNFIPLEKVGEYAAELNFFPNENLLIYKVRGEEVIGTILGSYKCTIVEGYANYDTKFRYWMINDMPGVYARIVEFRRNIRNVFGYTAVYEINAIK